MPGHCRVASFALVSKETMLRHLDIRPFALPNTPANEVRFEDPRDVIRVVVTFRDAVPLGLGLSYLHKTWPKRRVEAFPVTEEAFGFGWFPIDDWFNSTWKQAEISIEREGSRAIITFSGVHTEFPDITDQSITYRRTLGVRVDGAEPAGIRRIEVYTRSQPAQSSIRVALDAGGKTPGKHVKLSGYNARIRKIRPLSGVEVGKQTLTLGRGAREFMLDIDHMTPSHLFSNDEGHVTFELDDDAFTISLDSLHREGPIWFEDKSVFITLADDAASFDDYRARCKDAKNLNQLVSEMPEQSLGGATNGQPRPHQVSYSLGVPHSWQRYWIEANGDILLPRNIDPAAYGGKDAGRSKTRGDSRFFFDLGGWVSAGRHPEPSPVIAYNNRFRRDGVLLEQKTLAVPLEKSILDGDFAGDENTVCLARFRFTNEGTEPATAEMPISYSPESRRSYNRLGPHSPQEDEYQVPLSPRDRLTLSGAASEADRRVTSEFDGADVLRCTLNSTMDVSEAGDGIILRQELQPGESCEALLKIPYIALEKPEELKALAGLDFEKSLADVSRFWHEHGRAGAHLGTPEPRLDALYASHFSHVSITDIQMPEDPELINTSVGTSTYYNYCNESCMIIEELEQRGLHEEVRKRLNPWLRYQGTKALKGNFTDHDDLFFGCGGFEGGDSYDQHHGWVLWMLAEHYFYTRDDEWLKGIAGQIAKGVEWVHRQRNVTKADLPHSRGWEYGWLAAGALEDVDDYFYWLSTNALTWRGVEYAARALEAIDHADAPRVRAEADDYRKCLIDGFEKSRRHSPLVRLRDGRWVPQYPSRLYRRGRDVGWIREILEGAVYLLISGLYDPRSKQGGWILDDFQDNRYMSSLYGYPFYDPKHSWFDYGGFSCQPNLLAGLLPHLDRDEPEVYIWMFFNAWAACYREEIDAMVEHPAPTLGWSNSAHFKTSDQANAVKWLRYMFVYAPEDGLYIGRAIPRAWFEDGRRVSAQDVSTRFGDVSVEYDSNVAKGIISASITLSLHTKPARTLLRFRHPEKQPIKSVKVNGKRHSAFDPEKGDVDITGIGGEISVEAAY